MIGRVCTTPEIVGRQREHPDDAADQVVCQAVTEECAVATVVLNIGLFLLIHSPITLIAGLIGVWPCYVQHQFDPTFWVPDKSGRSKKRLSMAVRITTCWDFCAGSRQTLACIMCITCAAAFRISFAQDVWATIPSYAA